MPGGNSVYRFGPFELDVPRGRPFRGATWVPLSDPQVAILLLLVSHVGRCARLPAEPTLNPTARPDIWAPALAILRNRAT